MAALAKKKKKQACRKTVQIEFLCVLVIPVLSDPPPTPAWFVHEVPWPMEASKSSEGKYLDDPDGRVEMWEWGRDDGGWGAWWKCCKAMQMWRICSASVMTGEGVQRRQVSILDPPVSPRMAAPLLWWCINALLEPLIQPDAVFFTFYLFAFHINLLSLTLLWQLCFLVAQVLMAV